MLQLSVGMFLHAVGVLRGRWVCEAKAMYTASHRMWYYTPIIYSLFKAHNKMIPNLELVLAVCCWWPVRFCSYNMVTALDFTFNGLSQTLSVELGCLHVSQSIPVWGQLWASS